MKKKLDRKQYPARGGEPREMEWPDPFSAQALEEANPEVFGFLYEAYTGVPVRRTEKASYVLLFLWPGSPVHDLPGPRRSIEAGKMVGLIDKDGLDALGNDWDDEVLDVITFNDIETRCYHQAYNEIRINAAARVLDHSASFEAALFHRAMMEINNPSAKKDAWLESKAAPEYAKFFRESAGEWADFYTRVFRAKEAEERANQEEIDEIGTPSQHEKAMSEEKQPTQEPAKNPKQKL